MNQGYDKYVAKTDKKAMRSSFDLIRRTTSICKGVVDQWSLVHVGLAAVRAVDTTVWVESFKACNLNPHHRVAFPEWCQRISSDLEAGQQFKAPNPGAPVVPPLVPSAKKARFRILLYTGPYYKEFDVPAASIGRSARLFLVIQKENFKKKSLSLCKTRKRNPTAI